MIEKESWRIIELVIRRYPDKKKEYEEYVSDIIMGSSTGEGYKGTNEYNRPQSVTEAKALKMTSAYMDRLKREIYAVESVYGGLKDNRNTAVSRQRR